MRGSSSSPRSASSSGVPSLDALSTRTMRSSACVCPRSASRHSTSSSLRLNVTTAAQARSGTGGQAHLAGLDELLERRQRLRGDLVHVQVLVAGEAADEGDALLLPRE